MTEPDPKDLADLDRLETTMRVHAPAFRRYCAALREVAGRELFKLHGDTWDHYAARWLPAAPNGKGMHVYTGEDP